MTIFIPTHNNYVDLEDQDQSTNHAEKENHTNNVATSGEIQANHETIPTQVTGIDLSFPTPQNPYKFVKVIVIKLQGETVKDNMNSGID